MPLRRYWPGHLGLVTAFPLWAILIIALDVIVIYQLLVRWEVPLR